MSGRPELHLPAELQRRLGHQLGLSILRDMGHRHGYRSVWQLNAAVYGLQEVVAKLGVTDVVANPSLPGAHNVVCRVLTKEGKDAFLRVIGHRWENETPLMLAQYRRLGIAAPEMLDTNRLWISVPLKNIGSYKGSYQLTSALPGENVQKALDRGYGDGADGTQIDLDELLLQADRFARRVIQADLSDADPARRARPWNEGFVMLNTFVHTFFQELSEKDSKFRPPDFRDITRWTVSRPTTVVNMDLAPLNILYHATESAASSDSGGIDFAVIDPGPPVHANRAMATAFYITRTRDPLLWQERSTLLDPLTNSIDPVEMVGAMSYFLNLEGGRKSIAPLSAVHNFKSGEYASRRAEHFALLDELPNGPYRNAAREAIFEGEITEARRPKFESEAERAFALTAKYWNRANELMEVWRDARREISAGDSMFFGFSALGQ